MTATFNIPSTKSDSDIEWVTMELSSLPAILAKQVATIHEAQEVLKAMKSKFADDFNASYSEAIPAGMVRRFGFNFKGMSFANVAPKATKAGKGKVVFTARKSK